MKGRQLSLEDVLNLEDGSKVWVEEITLELGAVVKNNRSEEWYTLVNMFRKGEVHFYEWIEEETPLTKMAQEIVNLRGLDLTDDNIEMIIGEFSK